jgi:hypothetical protein
MFPLFRGWVPVRPGGSVSLAVADRHTMGAVMPA